MDVTVSVIAGILLVVAALGTVFPILPGSMLAIGALLVWALVIGGWNGWLVFIIGAVVCGVGMFASTILAGTRLKKREIPNSSILVGALCGFVGMFLIPVVGLPVGFVLGLYGSEWLRLRDMKLAVQASVVAIKAVGLGMIVEFLCVCLAIATFVVGLIVHF
ncbi:hypothetical protein SAMN06298212_104102 [Ruaniaceae bacterium KH17]|nr:hypothetical protein SAMN06298212_104102 [Ruaniaceae bacterium KH17]